MSLSGLAVGSDIHFHFTGKTGCSGWFCWRYFSDNAAAIRTATGEHLIITVSAVAIGLALALPLALVGERRGWLRGTVLGMSAAFYAVPSLAAVVALYPIFGYSRWTVIVPLAGYSLVILVRNILAGLDAVPADAVDAAVGMGMGGLALLTRVRLPLAVPAIVAGLRLATVSTIELVVIGGLVGQGGYGEFIYEGFQNSYKAETTAYILLTIALAVLADVLWLGIQRWSTPWQRRRVAMT